MILVQVYAVVWFLYGVWVIVAEYREGGLKNWEAKMFDKLLKEPGVAAHYEKDAHGIRSKVRFVVALFPIAMGFMLGSIWPLVLVIRVGVEILNFRHRHDD